MHIAHLRDRALILVTGVDVEHFLQNIITTNIDKLDDKETQWGALLNPQGKILFDFMLSKNEKGFWFDLPKENVDAWIKRLTLYRLRSKVDIIDQSENYTLFALWFNSNEYENYQHMAAKALDLYSKHSISIRQDGRLLMMGLRMISSIEVNIDKTVSLEDYHTHRIRHIIPDGGYDFTPNTVFPHDVAMDCLGGIDYTKGCYIGQEVVSRMHHRGTARRRIVHISTTGQDLMTGPIEANGKIMGDVLSCRGSLAIGLVRLDRVRLAQQNGTEITVAKQPITITLPDWAAYG